MKKAAVIAGGGSWGGDTVGQLLALRPKYDVVVGTSTGACMAPLVALGEYDRLSYVYQRLTNDRVFDVKPFKDNMKPRVGSWLARIAAGKLSLGETKALYYTLEEEFTENDYIKLKKRGVEVIVTYTNLNEAPHTRYKALSDTINREEFLYYMWASACIPIISSVPSRGGDQLTDGGLTESMPIDYTISNFDCRQIDCFTHELDHSHDHEIVDSIWNFAGRVISIMREENKRSEIRIAQLLANKSGVKVNYRHMTHKPELHYAQFDPKGMQRMITTAENAIISS